MKNALSPKSRRYVLVFDDLFSDISFNSNKVQLPGLSLNFDNVDFGTFSVKVPNNRVDFGDLVVSVFIDKFYHNYQLIQEWIKIMANYDEIAYNEYQISATLLIFDYSNNISEGQLRAKVFLKSIAPKDISGIRVETDEAGDPFELADVTFKVDSSNLVSEVKNEVYESVIERLKLLGKNE